MNENKYISKNDNIREQMIIERIISNGEIYLPYIGQVKHTLNPILQYINNDIPEEDKEFLAEAIYCDLLYNESYHTMYDYDGLRMTNIGKGLATLLMDPNIKTVYIYCNNPTDAIVDFIKYMTDNDDKVIIECGDRTEFLSTVPCDSYFLSDVKNIKYITNLGKRECKTDIFVPEFKFNMMNDGNSVDIKLDFGKSANILLEEFNLDINTIKLPMMDI